jgi:sugar phosphate permease
MSTSTTVVTGHVGEGGEPPPAVSVASLRRFGVRKARTYSSRYKWVVLGVGFAAQAGFAIAFQGIPVTGSVMKSAYHLSTGELGLLLSFMSMGIALSDVGWGLLTDRFGERRILNIGLFSLTAALAVCALFLSPVGGHIPSAVWLGVGLFVAGVLGGSVNGASGRAIMAWFRKGERGFAISLRVTAVPAGGAIGAALLPLLALHAGFGVMFWTLAAVALAVALATYVWLDEPPLKQNGAVRGAKSTVLNKAVTSGAAPSEAAAPPAPPASPLRNVNVWRVAVASGLLNFPQFIVLTFGSVLLHDVEHLSFGLVALIVSLVQLGGAVGRVSGGRWTDKRGGRLRRALVKAQGTFVAVGFAAIALLLAVHGPVLLIAVLITLAGMMACGWQGVAYAEIAEIAGAARSGTALGLENTMVFGGAFITPILIPVVLSATGLWWATILILGTVPALAAVLLVPREQREA